MSDQSAAARQGLKTTLLQDLIYNVIGPIILYQLFSPHMLATYALLLAGVLPAARTVIGLVRRRTLNPLGALSLLTIVLKIFFGLVLKDARLILLSHSLSMGCIGLLALASLFTQKSLIKRLVVAYRRDIASPEQGERFKKLLESKRMHSLFKLLTAIWGGGLLLELALRAILVYSLTIEQVMLISPFISYGILGGLLLLTTLLLKQMRRDIQQETLEEVPEQLSSKR
jgi:hypothetical protein